MTPRDVLRLTSSYYEAPRIGRSDVAARLDQLRENALASLSGGEQQRTLLALALLVDHEPWCWTNRQLPSTRRSSGHPRTHRRGTGARMRSLDHDTRTRRSRAPVRSSVIMHLGRCWSRGARRTAGSPEMIVQSSGPVDPALLASRLHCDVTLDNPLQLRCAVASTPERIAVVTNYLASVGLSMVSLRTRASLEERYLELIGDERSDVRR